MIVYLGLVDFNVRLSQNGSQHSARPAGHAQPL